MSEPCTDHSFPEEREPSGRLILAPCLTCGLSAMDALTQTARERDGLRIDHANAITMRDGIRRLFLELAEALESILALRPIPNLTSDDSAMRHATSGARAVLAEAKEWLS